MLAQADASGQGNALTQGEASARNKAVSAVKMMIGKTARLVGQEAIQMHGGMGITADCLASHYFRRLTMIGICFGDDSPAGRRNHRLERSPR